MLLPAILVALWPIATFAGGKLFAPLLFVSGLLLGRRHLLKRPRLDVLMLGVFLSWVCLTSIWSPADIPLISGSLAAGSFAIEAAHIRFVLSALGGILFLAFVAAQPQGKASSLTKAFPLAILLQLGVLILLAVQRDHLLVADSSHIFVPSPQSLGRNANLLALVLPLAVGVWADRFSLRLAAGLSVLLLLAGAWVVLEHDALAGLLGWGFGVGIALLVFGFGKSGFRWAFNLIGAGVVATPFLGKGLLAIAPPDAVALPLSAEQRLVIWQTTIDKIASKPIVGHGVDAVNVWDETYASRPDLLAMLDPTLINARLIPNHTHNMPLQIWAETGLVGAVLFALVLVLVGRMLPAPETLTRGTRIAIAGLMGGALALFTVAYSAWDESFWASLAVVSCGLIMMARQSQSPAR